MKKLLITLIIGLCSCGEVTPYLENQYGYEISVKKSYSDKCYYEARELCDTEVSTICFYDTCDRFDVGDTILLTKHTKK